MSRQIVSNQGNPTQIIGNPFTTDGQFAHRMLVFIEIAPPNWLKDFALKADIHFVSPNTLSDRADRISALLGREHKALAYELHDPMDAGILAALAGTITRGGLLLIASPFSISTRQSELDDERRSHFFDRFARLLRQAQASHPETVKLITHGDYTNNHVPISTKSKIQDPPSTHSSAADSALEEQNNLLDQAWDHLTSNQEGCISIVGKRGRGKTSLLARIANRIQASSDRYCITALNKSAITSFYRLTDHASESKFGNAMDIPARTNQIVLVDEAANFPISILQSLIQKHNRIVFCTTVAGYESAGRAFQVRFSKQVSQRFENPLLLTPVKPWRWLANDPIEKLIDRLVLNSSADIVNPSVKTPVSTNSDIEVLTYSQQTLSESESELTSVYGLLRDTHYQTSVKDLQHLLDGSNLQIWALKQISTQALLAVALVTIEPEIEPSLHKAIVDKERRLPHHLLAQLLAQCANTTSPLDKRFARVTRISVIDEQRRSGLGSKLVQAIEQRLLHSPTTASSVDAIGASYANDPISVQFWKNNGYTEFHEGFRKNPRTALSSSAVLKTRNGDVLNALKRATEIHEDNRRCRGDLNEVIANASETPHEIKHQNDKELINQFVLGHRSYHDTVAAISRLMIQHKHKLNIDSSLSNRAQEKKIRQQVSRLLED